MPDTSLIPADHVMHAHLAYIILAERDRLPDREVQVLDCGFGSGKFLQLLVRHVPDRLGREVSPWGYDVTDDKIQQDGFSESTSSWLSATVPEVDWSSRLTSISKRDPVWPYDDASFDVIVSNQVGEHIFDLDQFFGEVARTLRMGGISAHLFPTRDYVLEGHIGLPFVHRIESHDTLVGVLRDTARRRLTRFGPLAPPPDMSPEEYAESRADFLQFHTRYRRFGEIASIARAKGLRVSYRYTPELYLLKLGYRFGFDPTEVYRRRRRPLLEWVMFTVCKRISSITVFLEKVPGWEPDPIDG